MIFAILASILPTDTSALESAISALESSISALESSIAALDGSLAFWELLGFASAGLVVIGVLLELHDVLHRYDEEMVTWALSFFGVVRSLERPRFWKKYRVELASVILVAGGVAGELGAGLMIESKNTALQAIDIQLRSKNSALRSKSDQLLGIARKEARDAETTAKGFEAQIADSNAKAKSAEETAETERLERVKIEAKVAWRHLDDREKSDLASKLGNFPPNSEGASFWYIAGDLEAGSFAIDLAEAIKLTKVVVQPPGDISMLHESGKWNDPVKPLDFGVSVLPTKDSASETLAKHLIEELNDRGFDAYRRKEPPFKDAKLPQIEVFVYSRPQGPQGEFKLQAEREEKAKKTSVKSH
jgi:hypothetical protein